MSKKYKGKICVYCADRLSATADHVIAREFFLLNHRHDIPKVPACERCNRLKSELEHYLTAVLPFGGRHPDARANFREMVPKRLHKNAKLRAQLVQGFRRSTLPIDSHQLELLFALIAKGLVWHYWKTLIGSGYSATATAITEAGAYFFRNTVFNRNAHARVNVTLGENTFSYEGIQAETPRQHTAWRFSIYGGLIMGGDPKAPGQRSSEIFAMTGPSALIQDFQNHLL